MTAGRRDGLDLELLGDGYYGLDIDDGRVIAAVDLAEPGPVRWYFASIRTPSSARGRLLQRLARVAARLPLRARLFRATERIHR